MSNINIVSDKRRQLTGKIVLIFFLLMLFLTFFSKTITNYTLPKVKVGNPEEGTLLKNIVGEGVVKAKQIDDIFINAEINCRVQEIKVTVGNQVKKGDVLVVLDKEDIDKQVKIEMLAYEKLKSMYKELLDDYNTNANLKSLEMEIELGKKNYEETERKFENVKKLYESGAVSYENFKNAENELNIAKMKYASAQEGFKIAKQKELNNIMYFEYDIKMQEEKMNEKGSNSNIIYAPTDGIVNEINISKGSWVNNTTKLLSITDVKKGFEFRADIDADSAAFIKPREDKASIKIKSFGNELISGEVISINESKNFKGEKKEVVIDILDNKEEAEDKPKNKITGGERGEIYIEKPTGTYNTIVPNSAIIPGRSSKEGFVRLIKEKNGFLGKENYIEIKEISILESDNTQTAITGGILAEDKIVVKTDKPLYDNSRVQIVEETQETQKKE